MPEFPIDEAALAAYREQVEKTFSTVFPRGFQAKFGEFTAETKDRWFRERWLCLKYHLYLSGHARVDKPDDPQLPPEYVPIMGMDFQENPHSLLFKEFIQKRPGENIVFSDLDPIFKKRMILWPRGLFKTSAVKVDIVQTILNYPNIRICFLTGTDPLAKRQLGAIKKFFKNPSQRFKVLFPEFCTVYDEKTAKDVPAKFGTSKEFTVPCRTNDTFAEPTFCISTARSVKAGSHFDLIVIDDLVNEQNYRSVAALEKCYNDYLDICPVLDPAGSIVMTGTRYTFGDPYERIQEKAKEEERELGRTIWKFSIRTCWTYACLTCPHTDVYHDRRVNILQPPCTECACVGLISNPSSKGVLFPKARTMDGREIGWSLEWLEGEKFRLGPEFFANQYENAPFSAEDQTFTETMLGAQTIHDPEMLPAYTNSFTFAVGDLAYVGQEGRDYSVIFVCRLFQGQIFVIKCYFGHWDSDGIAKATMEVLLKDRPSIIYYEKFNGWEAYNNVISAYANSCGILKVPLQWEKGSQAPNAKLARIGAIKGVLSNKRVWLYALMNGYQILVNQLTKWPKLGRHDDFADCLGMVVAAPTGYQLTQPPQSVSGPHWLQKLHGSGPGEDSYSDSGAGTGINCG